MNKIKVDDLLGVRFCTHGRNRKDGFDCYGLAIEVNKRLGHELPDFDYRKSDSAQFHGSYESVLTELGSKIAKVDDTQYGDIVMFKDDRGRMVHIGVILNRDDFIHCDIFGVRIMKLSLYNRPHEVYRWQQ